MDHPKNVPDSVVRVAVLVSPHGVTFAGQGEIRSGRIVVIDLRPRQLTDVLAAISFDKAVQRVVHIAVAGGSNLIPEEDLFLRAIVNESDVTCGIVGIGQVLERNIVRSARGPQIQKAEGQWIVGVMGARAVAIGDEFALSFRVVADLTHKARGCERSMQIDLYSLDQTSEVVVRVYGGFVRQSGSEHAIQRIIGGAAEVLRGVELECSEPIHLGCAVFDEQLSRASQQIALEIAPKIGGDACAIVLTVCSCAQVMGGGVGLAFTIDGALRKLQMTLVSFEKEFDRAA